MHMPSGYLPVWLLVLCDVIAGTALFIAVFAFARTRVGHQFNVIQIGIVFLSLCGLYTLYVGTQAGMSIHWLGVMMTVMMFGPWLSLMILSAVHLTFAAAGVGGVDTLGFNIVVCTIVPTAVAAIIHVFAYHRLPRTVPVYLAKVGVGDLLCMLAVDLLLTFTLGTWFTYPSFMVWQDFTVLLMLMGGMEAVISTWIASLLVCFLPAWLLTFNDEEYLHNK